MPELKHVMPQRAFPMHACNYGISMWIRGNEDNAFVIPPFQRGLVWTQEQNVRFIESIWLELPIGSWAINRSIGSPCDNWLIDGQQRWNAIHTYVAGDFPVFGYRYPDLSRTEQFRFGQKQFTCLETELDDPAVLEEIFNRLAYGGTPNAPSQAEPPTLINRALLYDPKREDE